MQHHEYREIVIFWDYENLPLPSWFKNTPDASRRIHNAVSKYGRIVDRRLYLDSTKWNNQKTFDRSSFDMSGFDLVDTPTRGYGKTKKELLDKKIIVDILTFAWDSAVRSRQSGSGGSPCVVLISSDGDYSYMLSKLRDRGIMSIVMHGKDCSVAQILRESCDVALYFEEVLQERDNNFHETTGFLSASSSSTSGITSSSSSSRSRDQLNGDSLSMYTKSTGQSTISSKSCNTLKSGSVVSLDSDFDCGGLTKGDCSFFCSCVHDVQLAVKKKGNDGSNLSDCWANDSSVAADFKKNKAQNNSGTDSSSSSALKELYKSLRENAIKRGLIDAGRRNLQTPGGREVIKVEWSKNAGRREDLSIEFYVRLTEHGTNTMTKFRTHQFDNDQFFGDEKSFSETVRLSESSRSRRSPVSSNADYCSDGQRTSKMRSRYGPVGGEELDYNEQESFFTQSSHTSMPQKIILSNSKRMKEQSLKEDTIILCKCVYIVTKKNSSCAHLDSWGTDSSVSTQFKKETSTLKDRYKFARDRAVVNNLVEAGRRINGSKNIVKVPWGENSGGIAEGYSPEIYLRLSKHGEDAANSTVYDEGINISSYPKPNALHDNALKSNRNVEAVGENGSYILGDQSTNRSTNLRDIGMEGLRIRTTYGDIPDQRTAFSQDKWNDPVLAPDKLCMKTPDFSMFKLPQDRKPHQATFTDLSIETSILSEKLQLQEEIDSVDSLTFLKSAIHVNRVEVSTVGNDDSEWFTESAVADCFRQILHASIKERIFDKCKSSSHDISIMNVRYNKAKTLYIFDELLEVGSRVSESLIRKNDQISSFEMNTTSFPSAMSYLRFTSKGASKVADVVGSSGY